MNRDAWRRWQPPRFGDCGMKPGPRGRDVDRSTDSEESSPNEHRLTNGEAKARAEGSRDGVKRNADDEKPPDQLDRRSKE